MDHLRSLRAGGSTGGAAGLQTAYELAEKNFVEGGNNRVILATDGDFNVGPSTPEELTEMIETERESGVYVSVLGFGMYNLKDNTMEAIADHGNGNYAYIDTLAEARKVLVDEFGSTMFVVAKDLKLQVELNPAAVASYRLIGYDNRRLEDEDFDDDAKDAGDVGAGHAVTAFYELIPAAHTEKLKGAPDDDLKYSDREVGTSDDFMTVHVRYKEPGGNETAPARHQHRGRVPRRRRRGHVDADSGLRLRLGGRRARADRHGLRVHGRGEPRRGQGAGIERPG